MLQVGKEQIARTAYEAWQASAERNQLWGPGPGLRHIIYWTWDDLPPKFRQSWLDTAEAVARLLVEAVAAA